MKKKKERTKEKVMLTNRSHGWLTVGWSVIIS